MIFNRDIMIFDLIFYDPQSQLKMDGMKMMPQFLYAYGRIKTCLPHNLKLIGSAICECSRRIILMFSSALLDLLYVIYEFCHFNSMVKVYLF